MSELFYFKGLERSSGFLQGTTRTAAGFSECACRLVGVWFRGLGPKWRRKEAHVGVVRLHKFLSSLYLGCNVYS